MIIWLLACGEFTEQDFQVTGYDLWCEQSAACSGTFEPASCVDVLRAQDKSSCTFDAEEAEICLDELETAECFDDPDLDLAVLVVPASCELAYDCGGTGE